MSNKKFINLITKSLLFFFSQKKFGFVQGHEYINSYQMKKIYNLIGKNNDHISKKFEKKFSSLIGTGKATSFASARMAFYSLLKVFNVQKDDEIIIQAATCSVMINAILKVGAKPIYSDIDENTYGSNYKNIRKLISKKTKIIVVQHTFGIPCEIYPILKITSENNIKLIEDCALTVGSKINNIICGNFGDASIFSTDHSKPINTLIGGIAYTNDESINKKLKEIQYNSKKLSINKQNDLWNQFKYEKKFLNYKFYRWNSFLQKIFFKKNHNPFLNEDFGTSMKSKYPYPAKHPEFLSYLGIMEIDRMEKNYFNRLKFINRVIALLKNHKINVPSCYFDKNKEIVALRIFWIEKDIRMRQKLSKLLDISWYWFTKPIVEATEPLENYFYKSGLCELTESAGSKVINLPCNMDPKYYKIFLIKLEKILKSYKH